MKRRRKINKRFIVFVIILLLLLLLVFKPKGYHKDYLVDDFNVYEEFNNDDRNYYFKISNSNISFDYYIGHKRLLGKKKIKEIKYYENDKYTCIVPVIKKMDSIPLCYSDITKIDYHLVDDDMKNNLLDYFNDMDELNTTYNNINIYNLVNRSYLIWNYNNLISIKDSGNEEISIFDNDYYDISLSAIVDDYFVIPNYDENYNFNEFVIINLRNMNVTKWEINYTISKDSYILGTYNKSIFLVDKKNKVEYEYVPRKKKIRIVGSENKNGIIYDDGYKKVPFNQLVTSNYSFNYGYSYDYVLNNNILMRKSLNDNVLISNRSVKDIIYKGSNYVYYIVDSTLYYYDIFKGEVKVMDDFEWNFNYKNIIYPY